MGLEDEYLKLRIESNTGIKVPAFITNQPVIDPQDAANLFDVLELPSSIADQEQKSLIGLGFCRGRLITPDVAISDYRDEAERLPRTIGELLSYFKDSTRAGIDNEADQHQIEMGVLGAQLLQLERDILKTCDIEIPGNIDSLDQYLIWIAENIRKPLSELFSPTSGQLQALKFGFFRNYAGIMGKVYSEFNPLSFWQDLIHLGLTQQVNDRPFLQSYSYYQNFRDYDHPKSIAQKLKREDYTQDSLLFHTTSIRNAFRIVTVGKFITGEMLRGISFSLSGITHPRGGNYHHNNVAFVCNYGQLQDACFAMPFDEVFREHEKEVRSPVPTTTKLVAGIIPSYHLLFPVILKSGYAGDTLQGGEIIDILERNYRETGQLLSKRAEELMRPFIDQLVI